MKQSTLIPALLLLACLGAPAAADRLEQLRDCRLALSNAKTMLWVNYLALDMNLSVSEMAKIETDFESAMELKDEFCKGNH